MGLLLIGVHGIVVIGRGGGGGGTQKSGGKWELARKTNGGKAHEHAEVGQSKHGSCGGGVLRSSGAVLDGGVQVGAVEWVLEMNQEMSF